VRKGCALRRTRPPLGAATVLTCSSLIAACAHTPPGLGSPIGIAVSWTVDRCESPQTDRDADGVDDACELALAQAFAPQLIVNSSDCSFEPAADPPRLGGGYLFAVQKAPRSGAVRIAYMPAYYRDCGWDGLPCATRGPGCAAHDGDSELIVVETRQHAPARWVTDGVFLSAHCFGRSAGRCKWYRGDELHHFSWAAGISRGAPRAWVAKGKHANYPSRKECDTGHWYYDSCDGNSVVYRFPVVSNAQNVGSRRAPLPFGGAAPAGCFPAERLPVRRSVAHTGVMECFWNPGMPFRGWQRGPTGRAPAPYERLLRYAAEF
jgi:hypothetical protein